jgi:hypothetical protein
VTPPGTHTPITVTVNEIAPPQTPWSDWFSIAGGLSELKALRNADGRIILFGINSGGNLYRLEQRGARALQPSDWIGWTQMDTPTPGKIQSGTMAPVLDADGAVNLFVIGASSHQVFHAWQSPPCTATWSVWSTPGFIREEVQALAAGIDGSDHLVVVATDKKNFQNMIRQVNVEAEQWSGWTQFSAVAAPPPPQLTLDYNADGRLSLFSFLPSSRDFYCLSQMAFDSTEWELAWTQLGHKNVTHYAVVRDLTPPAG